MTLLDGCSWGSQERANIENADRKQKAKRCSPHTYSNPHHKQAVAVDSWVQCRRRSWWLILTVNIVGLRAEQLYGRWWQVGDGGPAEKGRLPPLLPSRCLQTAMVWPALLGHTFSAMTDCYPWNHSQNKSFLLHVAYATSFVRTREAVAKTSMRRKNL